MKTKNNQNHNVQNNQTTMTTDIIITKICCYTTEGDRGPRCNDYEWNHNNHNSTRVNNNKFSNNNNNSSSSNSSSINNWLGTRKRNNNNTETRYDSIISNYNIDDNEYNNKFYDYD